jgi:hypothetical protein
MMIVLSLIKSFSENDVHAEVNMNFCNVLDQEQFIRVKLSTQWDSRKKICCSSKKLPTTRKDGGVHSRLIHRDVINPFTANTKTMLSCISKHFFAETCFAGVKYYEYRKRRKYLFFFP